MLDKDPLVGIEPARMWDFEKDFRRQDLNRPVNLLKIKDDITPRNFIPGDWAYFLNMGPTSYEKTGYEGSNAIYLGRDKFDETTRKIIYAVASRNWMRSINGAMVSLAGGETSRK